ncbi:apoptosis facilitator Bcl-2-like protein 14 [Siniperca chuatsi]|uniref:apoptosis facilitator Bcl-2-like protein 14 n=1 Tax=Siniperca chuatsi TaxID=119488 RepID=UPI001CE1C1AF|nr:apoptosis facilitator Bcl-2-like protein 14 [Siniperca chuatsi]
MANGHGETHGPISNRNDLTSSTDCDPKSTSDTDSMGDTVELRLLMAYAKRRLPEKDNELSTQDGKFALNGGTDTKEPSPLQTLVKTEKEEEEKKKKKKKKKKKGWRKRLSSVIRCVRPQTVDEEPPQTIESPPDVDNRCFDYISIDEGVVETKEDDKLEEVVSRLTEIANEIPFIPPDIESDAPEDDVEKVIALLLREAGDKLNDKELKDAIRAREIFWNYRFFEKLIKTLLMRMGLMTSDPESLGPHASPKTQIAVTCEVTSRLSSAVDTLPMNRMLDHGARYLQDHFSSWAQNQGGYEEALYSEDEDN